DAESPDCCGTAFPVVTTGVAESIGDSPVPPASSAPRDADVVARTRNTSATSTGRRPNPHRDHLVMRALHLITRHASRGGNHKTHPVQRTGRTDRSGRIHSTGPQTTRDHKFRRRSLCLTKLHV